MHVWQVAVLSGLAQAVGGLGLQVVALSNCWFALQHQAVSELRFECVPFLHHASGVQRLRSFSETVQQKSLFVPCPELTCHPSTRWCLPPSQQWIHSGSAHVSGYERSF